MKANSFKQHSHQLMSIADASAESDELDEADIEQIHVHKPSGSLEIKLTQLEDEGFKMLDNESEPYAPDQTDMSNQLNVDQSGMVYLFDYEERIVGIDEENQDVEDFHTQLQLM